MSRLSIGCLMACLLVGPADGVAQSVASSGEVLSPEQAGDHEFVQRAREGTRRFLDVDEAIAAGYRRIGPDMPNMGEHWINLRLVLQDRVDPARPAILTYLPVPNGRLLTGVAFTALHRPGRLPDPPPIAGAEWHFHSGTVTQEASGDTHTLHDVDFSGYRLGMLHAWIWAPNPEGMFHADNWGLSFRRLEMDVPGSPHPDAARYLYLRAAGTDFYLQQARDIAALTADELEYIRGLLEEAANEAPAGPHHASGGAGTAPLPATARRWQQLWREIARGVHPERHAGLGRVRDS